MGKIYPEIVRAENPLTQYLYFHLIHSTISAVYTKRYKSTSHEVDPNCPTKASPYLKTKLR